MKRIDAIKSMFLAPFAIGAGKVIGNKEEKSTDVSKTSDFITVGAIDKLEPEFDINDFKTTEGAMIGVIISKNWVVLNAQNTRQEVFNCISQLMKKYMPPETNCVVTENKSIIDHSNFWGVITYDSKDSGKQGIVDVCCTLRENVVFPK